MSGTTSLNSIKAFLALSRIAAVGVSRNPTDFTRQLTAELRRRGYDIVPVHPEGGEIDGVKCFARIQDVTPAAQGALLFTPPSATLEVVRDCSEAGVRQVWMHRGAGQGAVNPLATAFCRENGIDVIEGECPYMFLHHSGTVHRLHGLLNRVMGRYPRAGCSSGAR